jgi:hypothetical protein
LTQLSWVEGEDVSPLGGVFHVVRRTGHGSRLCQGFCGNAWVEVQAWRLFIPWVLGVAKFVIWHKTHLTLFDRVFTLTAPHTGEAHGVTHRQTT